MMSGQAEQTLPTICQLLAELCALDEAQIVPEGELLAYGLDSVLALDLIVAIEQRWSIELPEHDPQLRKVVTVRDLARVVDGRRGST
jgi:acyl carrier protein